VFTGRVLRQGHPGRLLRVRLLARPATGGAWRVVATGVTNDKGIVRLAVTRVLADATFVLAGTDKLASAMSAPVTVTVTPHVEFRVSAADVLTVAIWPAPDGEEAGLQVLRGGTWQAVADLRLVMHRATYLATAGATYRIVVGVTAAHDAAVSASVTAPAVVSATPATGASPKAAARGSYPASTPSR
jgi:hypothetical protein